VSAFGLVLHQCRYELLVFRRDPRARFFTVVLPVILLVILVSVFGNQITEVSGHPIRVSTYYVPHLVALGVIAAALVNLVIGIVEQRESGALKRRRAHPVPAWVLIVGRALGAIVSALLVVVVLVAIGWLFYGVRLPREGIGAALLAVFVGSLCFCALAHAIVPLIGSADSAQPVVQALILPLYFISGVFFPENNLPHWLAEVGKAFPVYHLAQVLQVAFDPRTRGAGIAGWSVLWIVAWGAAGLAVATWRFSWAPRGG
jgi:ABC-2 type transport system permease protein